MTLLIYGIIQSILSTLLVRYIAQGRDLLATVIVTINAYIAIYALVQIVNNEAPWLYLLGVAIGTYGAMKWDKK